MTPLAANPHPGPDPSGHRTSTSGHDRHHVPGAGRHQNGRATGESADPDADNYYQLLGVPYSASAAEITRAYRAAMKRAHPDRHRADRRAAAEELTKLLNRAYATLSKPLLRQAYDRSIRAQIVQDQLMGRYVGGFHVPGGGGPDPLASAPRREPTPAERREQRQADRDAVISIGVVFGGVTLAVVALLLLWAVVTSALAALL